LDSSIVFKVKGKSFPPKRRDGRGYLVTLTSTLVLVLFLVGCGSTVRNTSDRLVYSYDWESRPLHPEFMVYHLSEDSSQFWLKVHSSELLYARQQADAPFEGRIACEIEITKKSEAGRAFVDSVRFEVRDVNPDQSGRFIVKKHNFKLDTGAVYRFSVRFTDLNRRWGDALVLPVRKLSSSSREDYLVFRSGEDLPLFRDDLRVGDEVQLETLRGGKLLRHLAWNAGEKLPPPPYTDGNTALPDLPDQPKINYIPGGQAMTPEAGLLTFFDVRDQPVLTLRIHDQPFPKVQTVASMVESLRYISSRREHEKMTEGKNPKKELDQFWLDCGGNKDRTRELIRVYYGRVQEANYYFSSLIDGWKTDRGLIHIIFGDPSKINRVDGSETWIYGEENHLSSLVFNFRRVSSPFTDNHYLLDRNTLYRTDWDRAVTAWRNGRIFQ